MSKIVLFDEKQTKEKFLEGVKKLRDKIAITIGPKGKNIIIKTENEISVVNDGYTISKSIFLLDDLEDLGAQTVKQVVYKANQLSGDGTTTATILAAAMIEAGFNEDMNMINVMKVKEFLEIKSKQIIEYLETQKSSITTNDQAMSIAMISSNYDQDMAKAIVDAFSKVTHDGYITMQKSYSNETYVNVIKGLNYETGLASRIFINNFEKALSEYNDPYIVYINDEVSNIDYLIPFMEYAEEKNKPLVFIAHKFSGFALKGLIDSRANGLSIMAINAPGPMHEKEAYLEDMIAYTGGVLFCDNDKVNLLSHDFDVYLECFGTAKKIEAKAKGGFTIVPNSNYDKKTVKKRIDSIDKKLSTMTDNNFQMDILSMRKSKLVNGLAVIYIGGDSEIQVTERELRLEDSVNSVRNAWKHGFLPGGGISLYRSISILKNESGTEEEKIANSILEKSLSKPLEYIIFNSEMKEESISEILKSLEGRDFKFGYNAKTGEICDMLSEKILDPFIVTKNSFLAAVSVASVIITTGGSIVEVRNLDAEVFDPKKLYNNMAQ